MSWVQLRSRAWASSRSVQPASSSSRDGTMLSRNPTETTFFRICFLYNPSHFIISFMWIIQLMQEPSYWEIESSKMLLRRKIANTQNWWDIKLLGRQILRHWTVKHKFAMALNCWDAKFLRHKIIETQHCWDAKLLRCKVAEMQNCWDEKLRRQKIAEI